MLDDFLVRATLAGVGLATAAGPLGCFVVWRRMAYMGDATAHAALLGVALALAATVPIFAGVLAVTLVLALVVEALAARGYSLDTALGVLAHGGLALGLVTVSLMPALRVDLMALLLGDILSVTVDDLVVVWGGAAIVIGLLVWRWSRLLTATLDAELALASGIDPRRESRLLMLGLALTVAVALKIVGALLISAMLILPAATVRPFAASPERMAVYAAAAGIATVLLGLWVSFLMDTPTAPTIVSVAALGFAAANLIAMFRAI